MIRGISEELADALEMIGTKAGGDKTPFNMDGFLPLFLAWERVSSDTVDFKIMYVDMAGDLMSGLLLSQIVYWHLPDKTGKSKLRVKKDGFWWIAKERTEWHDEIRLTDRQVDRCMVILERKGLVERRVYLFDGKRTTHTRIIWERFAEAWGGILKRATKQANHQMGNSNSPSGEFGLTQSVTPLTESTTENNNRFPKPSASGSGKEYVDNNSEVDPAGETNYVPAGEEFGSSRALPKWKLPTEEMDKRLMAVTGRKYFENHQQRALCKKIRQMLLAKQMQMGWIDYRIEHAERNHWGFSGLLDAILNTDQMRDWESRTARDKARKSASQEKEMVVTKNEDGSFYV